MTYDVRWYIPLNELDMDCKMCAQGKLSQTILRKLLQVQVLIKHSVKR